MKGVMGIGMIDEIMEAHREKIQTRPLPPDPARLIVYVLGAGARIEHILPLPPILETIHKKVHNIVEAEMPRLPGTAAPVKEMWGKYIAGGKE